jgi:hypothetical protein
MDDDDDKTIDLCTIRGEIGDESDLSSLASNSSLSLTSRCSSLVSRLYRKPKRSEKSLESLDPKEHENEINFLRDAKLSAIVRDRSLPKDEKARRKDEVNQWYAAVQQRIGERQQTENIEICSLALTKNR